MSEAGRAPWVRPGWLGESGMGKVAMYLIVLVVAGAVIVGSVYIGSLGTDEREELQEQLNERYVEQVELSVSNTAGRETIVTIDGEARGDCQTTDDGYLECEDEPQPTLDE